MKYESDNPSERVIRGGMCARRELNNRVRQLLTAAGEPGGDQEEAVRALEGLTKAVEEALKKHA